MVINATAIAGGGSKVRRRGRPNDGLYAMLANLKIQVVRLITTSLMLCVWEQDINFCALGSIDDGQPEQGKMCNT